MKKLLVLSLVLGIASLATAGLSLVGAGNTATVSNSPASGVNFWVAVQDTLTFTADFTAGGNPNGNSTQLAPDYSYGDGFGWIYASSYSLAPANPVLAGPIFNIIASAGAGQVFLYQEDGVTQIGQGATITPEPATLALLGLGALVLRKRK